MEHLNPVGRTDYLSIQHVERYAFAATKLVSGMKVLDIASGSGYGTALIAKLGCNVIGVDCDATAIVTSRLYWKGCVFFECNALSLPFDDETFDAVISFETIEHVKDNKKYLMEMKRVLRPRGLFICSTPNIKYTAHPQYHLKEYDPVEFYNLMQAEFREVEEYGQYFKRCDWYKDKIARKVNHVLVNPLISLIKKIGLEDRARKFYSEAKSRICRCNLEQVKSNPMIQGSGAQEARQSRYAVVNYEGIALLRIMIAVGRKGPSL